MNRPGITRVRRQQNRRRIRIQKNRNPAFRGIAVKNKAADRFCGLSRIIKTIIIDLINSCACDRFFRNKASGSGIEPSDCDRKTVGRHFTSVTVKNSCPRIRKRIRISGKKRICSFQNNPRRFKSRIIRIIPNFDNQLDFLYNGETGYTVFQTVTSCRRSIQSPGNQLNLRR